MHEREGNLGRRIDQPVAFARVATRRRGGGSIETAPLVSACRTSSQGRSHSLFAVSATVLARGFFGPHVWRVRGDQHAGAAIVNRASGECILCPRDAAPQIP